MIAQRDERRGMKEKKEKDGEEGMERRGLIWKWKKGKAITTTIRKLIRRITSGKEKERRDG